MMIQYNNGESDRVSILYKTKVIRCDNSSYADIMSSLTDITEDFRNNFVDMRKVVDFSVNEHGLQLYLEDGSGYFLER